MKSFCIQIIGLDQKQEGFYILFIQKYETNYYLESSNCLVGKFKRILLSAGINSLIVHLSLMPINQKQGFNQDGGINLKRNKAQRIPGARKN